MSREADLTWAAGLFEGEGSIHITRGGNSRQLFVVVGMTDEQCVREIHRIMGRGYVTFRPSKKTNSKHAWMWGCSSRKAAACLEDWLPYFRSDRVRHKASLGLMYQGQRRQGVPARDPDYKSAQDLIHRRLCELNRRGPQNQPRVVNLWPDAVAA